MPKETINTTNKFILPANGDAWSEEARRQLIEDLQKITPEQARAVGEELEKKQKEQQEREREAPQSLLDFRQAWKERIENLSHDFRDNMDDILKKIDQIPVKVKIDKEDGSRLIEFRLWWKTWKILDPKLEKYSEGFRYVTMDWMKWDVKGWKNEKLRDYVQQKQQEWLDIATMDQIEEILSALWEKTELDRKTDRIAMLMYLTGMDWCYWLWNYDENSGSRIFLECNDRFRSFIYCFADNNGASLCLVAEPTKLSTPKKKRGILDFFRRVNEDSSNVYK